jgi:hypothetical protein
MWPDRTHSIEAREVATVDRWIHPTVLVAMDDETEHLCPLVTLALGRRHPDALSFLCALRGAVAGHDPGEFDHALRRAFETVTDLGARADAILRGNYVEDAIRIFIALSLGSTEDAAGPVEVVEAIHRIATEFFDQTRLEVHVLALLPDLAEFENRACRYALAYRQLATLERLGDPSRPLGLRTGAPTDFRWVLDCRTRSGAYAGEIGDVLEPAAEIIALLLEGRNTGPIVSADKAVERLARTIHGRVAGYSTFGAAMLVHRRRPLARLLVASAALEYLRRYGHGDPLFDPVAADTQATRPPVSAADLHAKLLDWADTIRLMGRLAEVFDEPPPAADAPSVVRDRFRIRQDQRRAAAMDAIRTELETAVRQWLDDGGLAHAHAAIRVLHSGHLDGGGSVTLPCAVPSLHAQLRGDLERLLRLTELRERIEDLTRAEADARLAMEEGRGSGDAAAGLATAGGETTELSASGGDSGDVDPAVGEPSEAIPGHGADPGPPSRATLQAELESIVRRRESLERELRRRESLLDPSITPDRLEAELIEILKEGPNTFMAEQGSEPTVDPAPEPAIAGHPPLRTRFVQRARRLFGRTERSGGLAVAPALPVSTSHEPIPAARLLPERRRWLDDYARIVEDVRLALESHASAVAEAAKYYESTVDALTDAVTRSTNFVTSTVSPAAVERYRSLYLPSLREAIASRNACHLSSYFRIEPPVLQPFEHPLNVVLDGFDDALDAIASECLAPLLAESVSDVLSGRTPAGAIGSIGNVARMLLEASQPLARPAPLTDPGTLTVERWVLANGGALELFGTDPVARTVLDHEGCHALQVPDDEAIVFFAAHHGFAAQAIRKLLMFRSANLCESDNTTIEAEPVSLDALAVGPTAGVLRALVLALRLGLVERDEREIRVSDDLALPADLVEAVRTFTTSAHAQTALRILEDRIDACLQSTDGLDRLHDIADAPDLSPLEMRIILETLAEAVPERIVAAPR